MTTKTETVLQTLTTLITDNCSAVVERNSALPEEIPEEGLVVIYDGNPGQADQTLGDFDNNVYYQHAIDIFIFVEEGDAGERDTVFDDLVEQIKAVFRTFPKLNDEVFGLTYNHPKAEITPVVGGPGLKSGKIVLIADYEDTNH